MRTLQQCDHNNSTTVLPTIITDYVFSKVHSATPNNNYYDKGFYLLTRTRSIVGCFGRNNNYSNETRTYYTGRRFDIVHIFIINVHRYAFYNTAIRPIRDRAIETDQ